MRVLEGFAALAAARHRPAATLRLAAVAVGVRKSLGTQASSSHKTNLAAVIDSARSLAGADADRLWAEDAGMPLEDAISTRLKVLYREALRRNDNMPRYMVQRTLPPLTPDS